MPKAIMLIAGKGESLIEKTDYSIDDGYNQKRYGGVLW